ncbi:hypothetical protein AV530_018829 [Patagioenas fasciata monilis]|uniref:Uncharacterized protein n=1 Tax=Patagioenas fasciata monilis TaxID=372326 RepID=A0A1V4JJQ2_PATFA|nr:hypothetical protein AV530_018829 [Patagioenas fasciata monilis]
MPHGLYSAIFCLGALHLTVVVILTGKSRSRTQVFKKKQTLVNGVGEGGWPMKNIHSYSVQNLAETISSIFKSHQVCQQTGGCSTGVNSIRVFIRGSAKQPPLLYVADLATQVPLTPAL